MSLEPVPRRPTTFQTSTIWYFSRGTMNVRKSMTWLSSLNTSPPSSTHEQWSQPELKLHLPDSVKPPSVSMALPVGAYDELSRVLVSSPQTACCASSANSATCHGCTPTHAGDPAGRAAGRGDVAHGGVEVEGVRLEPVEPLRLQEPEEPGLLELLDRRLGHHPEPFGVVGPLAERGQQVTDAVEDGL